MTDLDELFRLADQIPTTEGLWEEIETRPPGDPRPAGPRAGRWVLIATALAVSVVGLALALRAFDFGKPGAETPPTPRISATSASAHQISLPAVVGQQYTTAVNLLSKLGLVPREKYRLSATVPIGIVEAQSPTPGTHLAKGSWVGLTVSLGPPPPSGPHHLIQPEVVVRSSLSRLVVEAPPGVARWAVTLTGGDCGWSGQSLVGKTGSAAGGGGCNGNAILRFALGGTSLGERGSVYRVVSGGAPPLSPRLRVRVTLVDGEQATVTPRHGFWIVISKGPLTNVWSLPKLVELLRPDGTVITRVSIPIYNGAP